MLAAESPGVDLPATPSVQVIGRHIHAGARLVDGRRNRAGSRGQEEHHIAVEALLLPVLRGDLAEGVLGAPHGPAALQRQARREHHQLQRAVVGHIARLRGAVVVDNSSQWRMEPGVPLVVAGVNDEDEESAAVHAAGLVIRDLPRLASLAYKDVCHQLNPRPCTEEDLLALYKASLDDG